jgi:hypothetical protein
MISGHLLPTPHPSTCIYQLFNPKILILENFSLFKTLGTIKTPILKEATLNHPSGTYHILS